LVVGGWWRVQLRTSARGAGWGGGGGGGGVVVKIRADSPSLRDLSVLHTKYIG
jgi:hypothetical protein